MNTTSVATSPFFPAVNAVGTRTGKHLRRAMPALLTTLVRRARPALRGWPDALIVVAIVAGWFMLLAEPVRRVMPVVTDTFRDTAYVENILEGRIFDDPSISGLSYWYTPGGPLLYAAAVKLTGLEPLELYSRSILWVNVWIPVGLFLLVRLYWDRATGIIALLMIVLGSRWWQTYMATPTPSVQGMILVLLSLATWRKAVQGGLWWSVVLGVVLAVCTWHHIVSAVVVSGAIGCHALLWTSESRKWWRFFRGGHGLGQPGRGDPLSRPNKLNPATPKAMHPLRARSDHDDRRYAALKRAGVAGAVCAVLVWPLVWQLLTIPLNHMAPVHYYAPRLDDPAYALHSATPLLIPLAVVGVVMMANKLNTPSAWVLGYLLVGLTGQAIGYLKRWTHWPIPILVPHEFQWHGQVAVGILAAVGAVALGRRVARDIEGAMLRRLVSALAVVLLVVLVAAPDGTRAFGRFDEDWMTARCSADVQATMDWIKRNSEITDVFVGRYLPAYYEVAARTGRKLILMPELRANIAVDARQRRRDLHRLETTQDPQEFLAIAVDRYGARFAYLTDRNKHLLDRWSGWDTMEIVYRSPNGERSVLGIIGSRGVGSSYLKKGRKEHE